MQTALFPSTYISDSALESLQPLFGPLVVYQPLEGAVPEKMRRWEAAGRIRVRIPVADRSTDLLKLSRSYRQWLEAHPRATKDFLKFQVGAGFLQESSAFGIRDEIRRMIRPGPQRHSDPLIAARLFLLLAQEADIQQTEVQEDLRRVEEMEIRLFGSLKGDPPVDRESFGSRQPLNGEDDPALSAVRRKAWAMLAAEDGHRTESYVTLSRAAFEEVLEGIGSASLIPGFHPEPIDVPAAHRSVSELREELEALAEAAVKGIELPVRLEDFSSPAGTRQETRLEVRPQVSPRVKLTLRVARNKTPVQVFQPEEGDPPIGSCDRLGSNTLIWHAEIVSG